MEKRILILIAVLCAVVISVGMPVYGQQASPEQVQRHYHRAETAWKNRTSLLEAKVRVDRVLEEAPDHADALKLRAEVLMAMKRYEEALRDSRRATELNPDDPSAYLILAESARLDDRESLARQSLDKAATLSINEGADFHLKLSRSAMLLGEDDWPKSESYARIAHAKEPDNVEAYYQLARVFVLRGNREAGAKILEKGLKAFLLDPDYIRNDATLQSLEDHPTLEAYLE